MVQKRGFKTGSSDFVRTDFGNMFCFHLLCDVGTLAFHCKHCCLNSMTFLVLFSYHVNLSILCYISI